MSEYQCSLNVKPNPKDITHPISLMGAYEEERREQIEKTLTLIGKGCLNVFNALKKTYDFFTKPAK